MFLLNTLMGAIGLSLILISQMVFIIQTLSSLMGLIHHHLE